MIYAIAAVLVLILDQAVKFWTTKNILLDAIGADCVELIRGVVHMTNVHNYGAAFSILENARWLLIVITLLFIVGIVVLINREIIHTSFGKWSSVLVVAGAIGNCIDRVLYGYVVDMFEFEFFSFPVFNVADIFITVCGVLFCIHLIFHNEPEEVKAANEPDFIRRRKEEKAAKEAPYSNIPRRGEHKSLEEELRAADPDDPFSEWDFGDLIEEPAPEQPADTLPEPEPEPELPLPKESAESEDIVFSFEPELPIPQAAVPIPEQEPVVPAAEEPAAPEPEPELELDDFGEFSLDDILSEFGNY